MSVDAASIRGEPRVKLAAFYDQGNWWTRKALSVLLDAPSLDSMTIGHFERTKDGRWFVRVWTGTQKKLYWEERKAKSRGRG